MLRIEDAIVNRPSVNGFCGDVLAVGVGAALFQCGRADASHEQTVRAEICLRLTEPADGAQGFSVLHVSGVRLVAAEKAVDGLQLALRFGGIDADGYRETRGRLGRGRRGAMPVSPAVNNADRARREGCLRWGPRTGQADGGNATTDLAADSRARTVRVEFTDSSPKGHGPVTARSDSGSANTMTFSSLVFFASRRTPRPSLALAATALLALGLLAAPLPAQSTAAGAVAGRVSDAATGKSLQGAVVKVLGTTAVAYTDAEGRFTLPGLAAGSYRVEVDYVGLDAYTTNVAVSGGLTASVNALLESKVMKMESFTVAESVRGQALAINQQKTASGIVNIVSEETFSTNLGGNIGFTLQQLPGLSVDEGEDGEPSGVNIRGLEAKYNSVQVDGNRMPTSGNSRAFSIGQLNAESVSNIEVIKAATPDRDGDALGGIINVVSRSAFQREGRSVELNLGGLYYDMREKWNYNAALNYLDIFSVGGQKNLGVGFNLAWSENSRDYDNLDKDYAYLRPQNEPALGLTAPLYFHTNAAPQTNYRETSSRSVNLALDYRLSAATSVYLRPFFRHNDTDAEKPRARYYINANHNFAAATGTKTIAQATYNTGRSLPTTLNEMRYQNDLSETDNDVYGSSFGGRHEMDNTTVLFDLFLSTNESNRDRSLAYVVRNQGFSFAYDMTNRSNPIYTILNGKDPNDVTSINRGDLTLNPRDGAEKASSAKVDVEHKFSSDRLTGSFKVGAKFRSNVKEQDQASIVYQTGTNASGFPYASLLQRTDYKTFGSLPIYQYPDLNKVEALLRSSPNLFVSTPPPCCSTMC